MRANTLARDDDDGAAGLAARGPQPGWLEVVLAWPEQIAGLDRN
jgi:hypothetical protein